SRPSPMSPPSWSCTCSPPATDPCLLTPCLPPELSVPVPRPDPDRRPRLSPATLAALPPEVTRPGYDRSPARARVVHLGVLPFHRAHQAVVLEQVLESGDLDCAVHGASLRSPEVRDRLAPQGGLYALQVQDGGEVRTRVVGALKHITVAPEDPGAVIEQLAD